MSSHPTKSHHLVIVDTFPWALLLLGVHLLAVACARDAFGVVGAAFQAEIRNSYGQILFLTLYVIATACLNCAPAGEVDVCVDSFKHEKFLSLFDFYCSDFED